MTAAPRKLHMRCSLAAYADQYFPDVRAMSRDDIEELGRLFYAAYLGTVDYEGESEQEAIAAVAATFDGEFGPFVPEASMVLEKNGQLVSAAFITVWQNRPLVAFAVTRPDFKGQGCSQRCTGASMHALAKAGHVALDLFVTETNSPARATYARLGFVEVSAERGGVRPNEARPDRGVGI